MSAKIYETLAELIRREIAPALDPTEFDVDGFAQQLRDMGLIVWVERRGFMMVTDEDGETPGFGTIAAGFARSAN